MRSEDVQAGLLGEQRLAHHFRKRSLDHLIKNHRRCGESGEGAKDAQAVRVFLEPLTNDVPADVPAPARPGERALQLADRNKVLIRDDTSAEQVMRELYNEVLSLAQRGQQAAQSGPGVAPTMEAEVISEVEAEAEAEEEQEQEQEQEQEKNQEQEEMVVQEAGKQSYSREDETVRPWSLRHLAEPPKTEQDLGGLLGGKTEPPFYPWGRFAVYRSGINKAKPLHWPSRLWISNNYFRSQWSLRTYRRLKNVICAMEWQPPSEAGSHAPQATVGIAGSVTLSEMQCDRVKSAFGYLDEDTDGMVTAAELATLGRAVDLESVAHFAGAADPTVGALPVEMVVPLVQEQLRSHAEGPGSRLRGSATGA